MKPWNKPLTAAKGPCKLLAVPPAAQHAAASHSSTSKTCLPLSTHTCCPPATQQPPCTAAAHSATKLPTTLTLQLLSGLHAAAAGRDAALQQSLHSSSWAAHLTMKANDQHDNVCGIHTQVLAEL